MILTVTANPAIDITWALPAFRFGQTYTVRPIRRQPAGKGVNVSLVLSRVGVASEAAAMVGAGDLGAYESALSGTLAKGVLVQVAAATRRNLTLLVDGREGEMHLREPGASVSAAEVDAFEAAVWKAAKAADVVAMAGSLPPGLTPRRAAGILARCRDCRTVTVLDGEGPLLAEAAEAADLIKGNLTELGALCGRGAAWADGLMAADEDALVKEVSAATAEAPCRGVCVTCGRRGAMLRLGREAWYGRGDPPGRIVNTCGAGDAFLAGYLWGLAAGDEPPKRLRKALACGTASCMAEGTAEVDARLVERLLPDVTILPVA